METKNCYPARDPTRTRLPSVQDDAEVAIPEAPREIPEEIPREATREAVTFPLPRFFGRWVRIRTARLATLCVLIGVGAGVLLLPIMVTVSAVVCHQGARNLLRWSRQSPKPSGRLYLP